MFFSITLPTFKYKHQLDKMWCIPSDSPALLLRCGISIAFTGTSRLMSANSQIVHGDRM